MRLSPRFGSALLLLFGSLVALAAAEAVARWLVPDRYYVYPPGYARTFEPSPAVIPGVAGPSRFSVNELGIRGGPFTAEQRYRILAVGGSTTLCIYLDDAEAWPHLVEERLDAALGAGSLWVGNVGGAGHTTVQNALQVVKLLPQSPAIDAVVLLVGVNDLLLQLALTLDPQAAARIVARSDPVALLESAFSVFPGRDVDAPWYWRTGLGRLWTTRRRAALATRAELALLDTHGERIGVWRAFRKQAAALRDTLPDLAPALDQYARNLERILDAAAAAGVRAHLLTQPVLWRENLPAAEDDLLWAGGPPLDSLRAGVEYYSVPALAEGMRRYNARLLEVCRARGASCFDLAAALPGSAEYFWDDVHFTEAGARRVAILVADSLLASDPLAQWPRPEPAPR